VSTYSKSESISRKGTENSAYNAYKDGEKNGTHTEKRVIHGLQNIVSP
jgi:hypothetical protein